jgi:hypothetical protein
VSECARLRSYLKVRLGHPIASVPLTSEQLDACIYDAKLWFGASIGQPKRASLTITSGGMEYDVASDALYVYDVAFRSEQSRVGFFDEDLPYEGWMNLSRTLTSFMGYNDIVQARQFWESNSRLFGTDQAWMWDEASRKLVIMPSDIQSQEIQYWYLTRDIDIEVMPHEHLFIVREYAVACAMETLGWIRTKYSEIPNASGSGGMNGETLLSRAESRKIELEEQISKFRPETPLVYG